jgi:hypothetical protein
MAEVERLLRELKRPHWMNWVALAIAILALVVSILVWQKPVVVNNTIQQPDSGRSIKVTQ